MAEADQSRHSDHNGDDEIVVEHVEDVMEETVISVSDVFLLLQCFVIHSNIVLQYYTRMYKLYNILFVFYKLYIH